MDVHTLAATNREALLNVWPDDPARAEWLADLDPEQATALMVWDKDRPAGYGVIQWGGPVSPNARQAYPDAVEFNHLYVFEQHRERGAASALIHSAEQLALERGVSQLLVSVSDDNAKARGLYERRGFKATGVHDSSTYQHRDAEGAAAESTETNEALVKTLSS